jgi:hypothetical protein
MQHQPFGGLAGAAAVWLLVGCFAAIGITALIVRAWLRKQNK